MTKKDTMRYDKQNWVKLSNDSSDVKMESDLLQNADSPCPCCGNITIPNDGNALAYICPICLWEIDFFIHSDDEPSAQNHGLTLNQARENYKKFGATLEELASHRR